MVDRKSIKDKLHAIFPYFNIEKNERRYKVT